MVNLIIWGIYGLFCGSVAKSIVPGDENFGFWKTVALGVAGSYVGGAINHLLGFAPFAPTGVVMGIAGSIISLMVYNKLSKKD